MIQRVCWATQSADPLIDQLQEPVYADTAPVLHKSNYTWKSGLKFTWNDMKYSIAIITSWYGKIVLLTLCEGIHRPPVPLVMLSFDVFAVINLNKLLTKSRVASDLRRHDPHMSPM